MRAETLDGKIARTVSSSEQGSAGQEQSASPKAEPLIEPEGKPETSPTAARELRHHHVTCSLDCPDSCRVIATEDVATGKLIRLAGDPAHPVTRGFVCGKVARYLDRVYAPDRLLYPMKRRAGVLKGALPHGREPESFERISWDEALDTVARRLQQISQEQGPESILPYSYAGTIGQLGFGSMDRRFFHRLGASQLDRTICAAAGGAALTDVYGVRLGMEPQSFAKSRLIIAWGANIHGNNIHLWPFIEQARRGGAKLLVIDPYRTRTAKLADLHLAIRPGTDILLAMSLMHVIVRDRLENAAYIEACTLGFASLRERVLEEGYAPENVARITGLPAEDIVSLARTYATTPGAAIRMNYGVQRSESGGAAVRAIAMLPLLTGAWRQPGGGLLLSTSGAFQFNQAALQMPELMQASSLGRAARVINMSRLGHALTELGSELNGAGPARKEVGPKLNGVGPVPDHPQQDVDPPIHALFVYNSNPAAIAPNQNAVLRGLRRPDLFTVVHDVNFTDTADYADILLPAPTWLEQADLQGAYGHHFVQLSPAAITPLGEARPNVWLFGQLARRMGFPESCFHDTESELMRQALHVEHSWLTPVTPEALTASFTSEGTSPMEGGRGFLPLHLPRNADGDYLPFSTADWFRTPSGRGEFHSSLRAAAGLDPLPAYLPGEEGVEADAADFPLQMLPRKADPWMNSTFANLPRHRTMAADVLDVVELHPQDAAARTISDGDTVQVTSLRGSVRLRAKLSDRVTPGICAAALGWNKLAADGRGINVLTGERLTDIGAGPTFYSTRVQIQGVAGPDRRAGTEERGQSSPLAAAD